MGKNFREWQSTRKKTLQIRLLTRKNNPFFHDILSYTIYFYISSPSRPFSLLCMPWRIKKAILEIFLGRKKLSRIEFFLEFRGKKLSQFTDLKFPKELTFAKKAKFAKIAKVSALKVAFNKAVDLRGGCVGNEPKLTRQRWSEAPF